MGDTVTIECDQEFELNTDLQSNILSCEADGQWSFNDFTNICTEIKSRNKHMTQFTFYN